ncbi:MULTISPECIES: complex I subunit 5 family protein [unclassified Erythrobacter]|uniref:complex I subunit 5 family protein n=1 Tax=unclassified Erythrobacter TaxID=2633097 RepID=UPI00076D927E|nr:MULTISPECIES: complex I subunit 5 family protein [unclassified Erythrobacter]KWV92466.1 hypothetical protein ASS64_14540 [Erythrobacter sp. AP23]MBO6766778.1 hypothetical protein [Erythrobacter sp.]
MGVSVGFLLACVCLFPFLCAGTAIWPRLRVALPALAIAAPIPALLAALFGASGSIELDWLLLGTELALDSTARVFLVLAAALWLAAAVYSWRSTEIACHRTGYYVFFLFAMTGNFLLPLAQDAVTFYLAFSLMGLASYGLVTQSRDDAAIRAGRWYMALTLIGELALFCGVVICVLTIGPEMPGISGAVPPASGMALIGVGLAIKAGVLPFHVWMPLAYGSAPYPAAAVMSGAMSKAAALGALRFLPAETLSFVDSGHIVMALGAGGAVYGVLAGLCQRQAKTALAYSSVSQMGLLTLAVGFYMTTPSQATSLAILLFVLHHGFAKAALFLGLGLRPRGVRGEALLLLGLAIPGAALAGLPLTSGAVAKGALKYLASESWALYFISASSIATTLLMLRILWLQKDRSSAGDDAPSHPALLASWLAVTLCSAIWPFVWSRADAPLSYSLTANTAFEALWPVVAGVGIAALATVAFRKSGMAAPGIPAGDIASFMRVPSIRSADELAKPVAPTRARSNAIDWAPTIERRLGQWSFITIAGTLVATALFFTLL